MVFYISVLTAVLGPFQCVENPNGLSTLASYQAVICWDTDEHTQMVVIAFVALLAPLAFLAHCVWVVIRYPAKMREGDIAFLRSYAFLFFRFRSEVFWFSLSHILRSLLLALAPVVPNTMTQLVIVQLTIVGECRFITKELTYVTTPKPHPPILPAHDGVTP